MMGCCKAFCRTSDVDVFLWFLCQKDRETRCTASLMHACEQLRLSAYCYGEAAIVLCSDAHFVFVECHEVSLFPLCMVPFCQYALFRSLLSLQQEFVELP
jgi:hypothetical protein